MPDGSLPTDVANRCRATIPAGCTPGLPMLVLLACLLPGTPGAQTLPDGSPGWRFAITPYAWLPSVDGTLRHSVPVGTPGGAGSVDVAKDSGSVLDALNFAGMIAAEARQGRFSVMTDLIYLDLGNSRSEARSVSFGPGGATGITAGLDAGTESSLRGTLWSLAGGYTLTQGAWGHLDGFAGFRFFSVSARTDVRLSTGIAGPGPGLTFARTARLSDDADLFDGVAGLRGRLTLGGGFHMPYAFDIGAGSSRLTWQGGGGRRLPDGLGRRDPWLPPPFL